VSRAAQNFRQRDLQRAMRVAEAAGKTVVGIRVDKLGAFIVLADEEDKTNGPKRNEWDQ
jgi:hypothetical protein